MVPCCCLRSASFSFLRFLPLAPTIGGRAVRVGLRGRMADGGGSDLGLTGEPSALTRRPTAGRAAAADGAAAAAATADEAAAAVAATASTSRCRTGLRRRRSTRCRFRACTRRRPTDGDTHRLSRRTGHRLRRVSPCRAPVILGHWSQNGECDELVPRGRRKVVGIRVADWGIGYPAPGYVYPDQTQQQQQGQQQPPPQQQGGRGY